MKPGIWITPLLVAFLLFSCAPKADEADTTKASLGGGEQETLQAPPGNFGDYWYQGKAEITTYRLQQARYGEVHEGTATAIFVTEDHHPQTHIKLDDPQAATEKVKVLKLNLTKKFNTGIYPYSMMLSVFNPVAVNQYPHAHRVTTSSQEWCGQTYTAIDDRGDSYSYKLFSYFESEGIVDERLGKVWLEDELWNQLRLNPQNLPTGEFKVIEGTLYQRLGHSAIQLRTAQGQLIKQPDRGLAEYTLYYPYNERKLTIRYKTAFPYTIEGWEETYTSGGKPLVTTATKMERLVTDYWNKNSKADSIYRKQLGLEE